MGTIERLPDDLLRELFDVLSIEDPPHRVGRGCGGSLGWVNLTRVNRRWRDVGISLPQLWARVVGTFPPDANVLQRAGDLPVTIDLDAGGRKFWDTSSLAAIVTRAEAIIDTGAEASRIDWRDVLDGRFLPVLRELKLCVSRVVAWQGKVVTPALQTCTCDTYIPLVARSLSSLEMTGGMWNMPQRLSILRHSPKLLQLYVEGIWADGDLQDVETALDVEQDVRTELLPSLQTLHFRIVESSAVSFLQRIRFPDNMGLRIDDSYRRNLNVWESVYSRLPDTPLHQHLSIICTNVSDESTTSVHRLTFTCNPSAYTKAVNILPGDLVVSSRNDFDHATLRAFLEYIPDVRAAAVRNLDFDYISNGRFIRNAWEPSQLEDMFPSLQRFHNVTTLRIGDAGFFLLDLLGSAQLLFPDLHTLIIHPEDGAVTREQWDEVRGMLTARTRRIPRLIVRGSMLCHTTEWRDPKLFDSAHSWKEILDECFISLEEERLLVDELLDEREGLDALPYCWCWSKICGF